MKRSVFLLLPWLLLAAAGCAGTALRPEDPHEQEIQALKARLIEMQREAAMNQVELAQLRQQVAELQARSGGSRPAAATPPSPARSSGAGDRPAVEPPKSAPPASARPAPSPSAAETRREPAVVAEPIEEVDIELPETAPQPTRRTNPPAAAPVKPAPAPATPKTQAPAQALPPRTGQQAPAPAPPPSTRPSTPANPPAPAPSPAPPAAGVSDPGEEPPPETLSPANQVLYDRGYTLYHQGRFVDAEASFQRFLQANPASELADNAQYWIGECRYARNELKGALAAFREVVERFPEGNKVADAMLKAGQCLEGLGDVEGARVTYREVARRFPGTLAANAADERRAKLP